jgi:type II secretory pathway component GspD/PulD (secretin)
MMLRKALRTIVARELRRAICAAMAALCVPAMGDSLHAQVEQKVQDLKKAQKEVQQGEKAEASGNLTDALAAYDAAAKDAPLDLGIVGHAAALRAKLVRLHVDAAENAAIRGDLQKATEELHAALKIDPGNATVAERQAEMQSMQDDEQLPAGPPEQYKLEGPPQLKPQSGVRSFNLRSDTRGAYEQVARAFGITAAIDPDLPSRNVRLRVDNVDFDTAMRILGQQTTTFFRPLNPTMIFVAADTIQKRREYGLEVEETFVLGATVDAQDMTDLLRALREITSANHIELDAKSRSVTIRDSAEKVKLAKALIKQVQQAHSELLLEIELLEVDKSKALDLGIVPPTGARAFALSSSDVKKLQQATDLANLLTLVQQVFAAQGVTSVPPVIPVGGGRSTFLLSLPSTSANFSDALSLVKTGREVLMRVQDTKPATFFVGQRFPVTLSLLSTSLGGTTVTGAIPSTVFPRTDFTVGQTPVAVAARDFNNDALNDIAVANQQDNSISILINQNNGNFTQPNKAIVLGPNETGPAAIASGVFRLTDVNHLTQPADLVIANSTSNTVTVLLGNGDGTFAEAAGSPFPTGDQPSAVVVADFNGDGNQDFAVANMGDNSISVFEGDGKGGFTPFPKSPFKLPGPLGIGTTSLPNGVVGTAYSTTLQSAGGTGRVTWSVTAGSLPAGLTLNASTGAISGAPAAAGTSNFTVTLTDSASPPQFVTKSLSIEIDALRPALAIATASLANGVLGQAYNQTLVTSGGKAPFTWSIVSGALPTGLALNATGAITGTPTVFGNFAFTVQVTDSSATALTAQKQFSLTPIAASSTNQEGPVAMVVGNFGNSGRPDLAIANKFSNNVSILLSSGSTFDGTFTEATNSPIVTGIGKTPIAIAAGDLNSDGVPDLAVVNSADSTISVLLNNGDATFSVAAGSPLATSSGANPSGVAIADFTNDGIGDIAVTNQGLATLGIYVGLGLGLYAPRIELSTPSGPQGITTADFTGNGLPDVALTAHSGAGNFVSVFLDPSSFASGGSVQVPYPASEYIDLGLKIKVTPYVHGSDEVTLQLEFEIRSLAGTAINGIPVINNQTLNQTVRLKQDETSLVGGLNDREAAKSLASLPGLGELPGVGYTVQNRNNTARETEFLILVTPRKLRIPPRISSSIYAGPSPGAGANALGPAPIPQPLPQAPPPPPPNNPQ